MGRTIDVAGQRFGRLIAIEPHREGKRELKWECRCDCGNTTYVSSYKLRYGLTKSCGCLHLEMLSEMRIDDLTGQKFGKLHVIRYVKQEGGNVWECQCDCGNKAYVSSDKLKSGHTSSCGCKVRKYDGESKTDLYMHYSIMKKRCHPRYHGHKNYYDKGVIVCDEWACEDGYLNFRDWSLHNGYKEGLSLDRIDNDGIYEPCNCRWVTMKEQGNNRTTNVFIEYNGEIKTLKQWSEYFGLNYSTVKSRRSRGLGVPELFSETHRYARNERKQCNIKRQNTELC